MHVNLNIIDSRNDTFVNRTRLSCKDKRAVNDQWKHSLDNHSLMMVYPQIEV